MSSEDGIEQTLALRMLKGVRAHKRSDIDDGWVVVGTPGAASPVVSADQLETFSDISGEVFEAPAAIAEVELTAAEEVELTAAAVEVELPAAAMEEATVLVASTVDMEEETVLVASTIEPSEGWTEVAFSIEAAPEPLVAVAMADSETDFWAESFERVGAVHMAADHEDDGVTEPVTSPDFDIAAMTAAADEGWTPVLIAGGGSGSGAPPRRPVAASASSGGSRDHGRSAALRAQAQERLAAHHGRSAGRSRGRGLKAGVAGLSTLAMVAGMSGMAFANAANPLPTTTGKAVLNPDGTVTVNMSGTWTWPGQNCQGRYGEGYAVDWWGVSSSASPANPFTLTNATAVTGVATTVTNATVSPVGSIAYKPGGTFFHTGAFYSGQDINTSSSCTDSVQGGGGNDTSTGPWSASATYPNAKDVPAQLCVIFYDEHGNEGQPSGGGNNNFAGNNDFSPVNDNDNSIDTNAFNPAAGQGYCLSPNFLSVLKTGPATGVTGGTGQYTMKATNIGGNTDPGVVIVDHIPAHESWVAPTPPAASPCTLQVPPDNGDNQTLNCPVGDLAAGASASVTVTVAYDLGLNGVTLTDCAVATSGPTTSNQSCVPTNIQQPNLTILKTGPATGVPGGGGSYTLKVSNTGSAATTSTSTVSDVLPTGETYSSDNDPAGTCSAAGQTVSCPVAAGLGIGSSTSFTVVVTYGSATAGQALTDCASVNGPGPCNNCAVVNATQCANCPANADQSVSCQTTYIVGVSVAKTNNAQDPTGTSFGKTETAQTLGETFTYQAVITNTSQIAETLTSVTDAIGGGGSTPVTCNNTPNPINTSVISGGTWTCDFTGTAPTTASATQTDVVTGVVAATSDLTKTISGTDTSTVLTPGATNLQVNVVKTNNASNPGGTNFQQTETAQSPGENFTYQAVISNPTKVDELISLVTDTVPTGSSNTTNVCANLVGTTLPAGGSVVCTFTGTAPAANSSLEDTVTVKVTNTPANPPGNATGTSTSTVIVAAQTLQGHIYLCNNNQPTTAEVTGGTIGAGGPQTVATTPNPLVLQGVAAGNYTVNATAPTGYTFAICNGLGSDVATPHTGTTSSQSVTVPVGGTGTAIFYVVPNTPGLSVSVVKTNNASDPTGTDFSKTQTAQSTGETFTYQAVISNTNTQPEVISTITDLLPGAAATPECASLVKTTLQPGQSVTCQFQGTAPSTNGTSITDTVTVTTTNIPSNPPGTATGTDTSTVLTTPTVIITKANNAAGTGYGSSETAAAGITTVPYQVVVTNNNDAPGTITVLTDTVNGTTMNICDNPGQPGNLWGVVLQPGESATCDFTGPVPTTPTTDTAGVTLSVNGILVTATAPSTVFPPVLGTVINNNPPSTPTVVAPTQLAFTGAPVKNLVRWAGMLLLAGLALMVGLSITDPRRRRLALVEGGWVQPSRSEHEASGSDLVSSGLARARRIGRAVMGESRTSRISRRYEGFRSSSDLGVQGRDGDADPSGWRTQF